MSNIRRVACIQNNAHPELQKNLDYCSEQIRKAAASGASFIATAEYFSGLKLKGSRTLPIAFAYDNHPVIRHFQKLAVETNADLLLGSIGVTTNNEKLYNRSVLLSRSGSLIGHYDNIHLFDVDLADGLKCHESATIEAGNVAKILQLHDMNLGMSICYDLRFPHLYRQLAQSGATVLAIPAAFSNRTGRAHWHTLIQSRAIENACFIIAPGQTGRVHGGGRHYGHSMIVSPWGDIINEANEEEGFILADIDLDQVRECRKRIPSLSSQKRFSPPCLNA